MPTAGVRVITICCSFELPYSVRHLDDSSSVLTTIAEFRPDVIVTAGNFPARLNDVAFDLRRRWINVDAAATVEQVITAIENCYAFNLWKTSEHAATNPLVSVYTGTYNTGDYLREVYESLVGQTYVNWEWVVVDDGSTDGTWDRLVQMAKEDYRVRPHRLGQNSGKIGEVKDTATRLCRGSYLVELDHDDMLTDFALDEIQKAFGENPDVGFVYSNCSNFFENGTFQKFDDEFWTPRYRTTEYHGKKWEECLIPNIYDRFGPHYKQQFGWFLTVGPHHVRAFRASTFRELGGYNRELPVADDWDLMARFFLRSKCLHIDKLLYLYRFRDGHANATFTRNKSIQDHLALGRANYAAEFEAFNLTRVFPSAPVEPAPIRPAKSLRVIVIAKNEEKALPGFFVQWKGLTEDFCLLDTGSSDNTIELAKSLGVKVETSAFEDFAQARNEAGKRFGEGAQWVLMLDLDERLDTDTISNLAALTSNTNDDIFLAPLTAVYPNGSRRDFVPKPFLWRNIDNARWVFKVHEKLVGSDKQVLLRNSRIEHIIELHEDGRRAEASSMYAALQAAEPYFTDLEYKKEVCEAWPILDYDHMDDERIKKLYLGPLISVIIPTYKRPELLKKAVISALAQDYVPLEVIVVGDACPNLNDEAFPFHEPPFTDERVNVINLPENHGAGGAAPRNEGIRLAQGDLVAYLDDDNEWLPEHLSSIVTAMDEKHAAFGFSSMSVGGKDLGFTKPEQYSIDTSCVVHFKDLVARYGPWKDRIEGGYAHDWEFLSRFVAGGEPWAATGRPTLLYNAETSGQAAWLAQRAAEAPAQPLVLPTPSKKSPTFLTVAVLGIPSRLEALLKLMEALFEQAEGRPVEVKCLLDNKTQTLSEKRNEAIREARGQFIAFVDDDDEVEERYVEELLLSIQSNPEADCVVFDVMVYGYDATPKLCRYGKDLPHGQDDLMYYRRPNHLMAYKTAIAQRHPFKNIVEEDTDWALRASADVKTETRISKVLYHYKYDAKTSEQASVRETLEKRSAPG